MKTELPFPDEDWKVRISVWIERFGRVVLGEDRLELLECIERCGSISAAAREVGVSFRHAWVTVREINRAAGEPLVAAASGGRCGGGAALTPRGRLTVRLCRGLQDQLQQSAAGRLPRLLPNSAGEVIHVAAAVSLAEVLGALVTDHALGQTGTVVRVVVGASDELAEQLLAGARVDLFLTANPVHLDRLAEKGVVRPDTVTALAENTLAAIGPTDLDAIVRRPADLLGPDLKRIALATPSCPLGGYTQAFLEGLDLYDAVMGRAVLVDHARAVVAAVQAGQVDAGLVYNSAATAPDCRVLFRARRPLVPIRYAGAVVHQARQPEQARRFLEFLTSAQAARRFRRYGFLPVGKRMGT